MFVRFKPRMRGQAVILLPSEGPLLPVRQVLFQPDQPTASSVDSRNAATCTGATMFIHRSIFLTGRGGGMQEENTLTAYQTVIVKGL